MKILSIVFTGILISVSLMSDDASSGNSIPQVTQRTGPTQIVQSLSQEDKDCLVKNIFYEGPRHGFNESPEVRMDILRERVKILNVTLNRVSSPKFPNTICEVVYQYKQFSWTLEKHKKQHKIKYLYSDDQQELANLKDIRELVDEIDAKRIPDISNGALYYHTPNVSPYWSSKMQVIKATKWHIYYKE